MECLGGWIWEWVIGTNRTMAIGWEFVGWMSMWDEEDGIMGEELVTRSVSIVGCVSKTASRMELEEKDGANESESKTKSKERKNGKREPNDEDEQGLWEVKWWFMEWKVKIDSWKTTSLERNTVWDSKSKSL